MPLEEENLCAELYLDLSKTFDCLNLKSMPFNLIDTMALADVLSLDKVLSPGSYSVCDNK